MAKYKKITPENFFERDHKFDVINLATKEVRPLMPHDVLGFLDTLRLHDTVPENVSEMFEVAKGTWAYGLLYAPLRTMGEHYGVLCVEAALYALYVANEGKSRKATMGRTLSYLRTRNLLPEINVRPDGKTSFDLVLFLRNDLFAHPKTTALLGATSSILTMCVELINALYP